HKLPHSLSDAPSQICLQRKCLLFLEIHLKEESGCTASRDTVCVCETGYYCSNPDCDHCRSVTSCSQGTGVKVSATRSNDTICQTCEKGTFSNVTDFSSPCKAHTRCEDIGRQLLTPGTKERDAVCGELRTRRFFILTPSHHLRYSSLKRTVHTLGYFCLCGALSPNFSRVFLRIEMK
uniref:TNFR-Cys domain-containing protein n=1 Tax=Oryzias sinensis TaxID=183150 RepID=A0A8C7Y9E4_9TELE